ncbi:MAG: lipocalin family protein [Candidatus Bipolaricaulota bacterium]|nr:lipocalin family protein [Candidatus Bipolaricaulota bacterium]MDW8152035.1 lipocalin family protein [Candidatus Bipolaricaulota bacterium]
MAEHGALWVIVGLVACGLVALWATRPAPPGVVAELDLSRFLGRWYALAHIPTSFERGCAHGTTATYVLLPNGQIEVLNECYDAQGKKRVARGRAWIPNPQEPAKLKVSFVSLFGIPLFAGDYWVIELAPDYSYAVVGHPTRRYGWILSRTPKLDEAAWARIKAALARAGYRWEQFVLIDQSVHLGAKS